MSSNQQQTQTMQEKSRVRHKARENACDQVANDLCFDSDLVTEQIRLSIKSTAEQFRITFGTQLKTALSTFVDA